MGKDTTTPKLVAALRDHFCHTAVLDLLWLDGGPQFTSSHLAEFLTTWGVSHNTSSPHYPQSNGKVDGTVKSIRSLFLHPGPADQLIGTPCLVPCSNIGTPHAEMTASHRFKSYLDTLCKIHCLLITDHLHQSGKSEYKMLKRLQQTRKSSYTNHTTNMPMSCPHFKLVTTLLFKILPLRCGVFMLSSQP